MKITSCNEIECLLIQRHYSELTAQEYMLIEQHIGTCERCKKYEYILRELNSTVKVSDERNLLPDPAIHRTVVNRMKSLKPNREGLIKSSWRYVKSFLEFRIPVYQVIVTAAILLLIVFALNRISIPTSQGNYKTLQYIPADTLFYNQFGIMKNLDILNEQKVGRTVEEDSAIAKYIVIL